MQHDKDVIAMFEARGWTVLRIWECELKKKNEKVFLKKVMAVIEQPSSENEEEKLECQVQ